MSDFAESPAVSTAPPAARVLCACAGDPAAPDAGARLRAALAEQLYGDSTLRTFSDLDLLVPSAHVLHARRVILAAGYQDVHPVDVVSPDRLLHAMQELEVREPAARTIVELH